MTRNATRWLVSLMGSAAIVAVVIALLATPASAQATRAATAIATPAIAIAVATGPPAVRKPADMAAFEAANPNPPVGVPPFLPTMDFDAYLAAKAAGAAGPRAPKRSAPSGGPLALVHGPIGCNGFGQEAPVVGGGFPPDTHAAIGPQHFGIIVNSAIRFYNRFPASGNCPPSVALNASLAAFFGYTTQGLFDPRIIYDRVYDRWVVSAEAFGESSTVQFQFIAVSIDSNPNNGFFVYQVNVRAATGPDVFWDFPQLGVDSEAFIVTANLFNPSYIGSMASFWDKHRMYAGFPGLFVCFFNMGTGGTVAPTVNADFATPTALTAAVSGTPGNIRLWKVTGTSRVCPTFLEAVDLPAATAFVAPPDAHQPGTAQLLDTLDGRFQNAGAQVGFPNAPNRLWQTRTDSDGTFPIPRAYRVNVDSNTIEEECDYFQSVTSDDFNPSIAANSQGTTFITWSSTDAPNGINAQVRITGKKPGETCATYRPGILDNQSTDPLTGNPSGTPGVQRWGDYSAVSIDPLNETQAWFFNEKVKSPPPTPTLWRTRFGNMANP